MRLTACVPIMFALIISMTVVGAIDLDELYKRAADAGKPAPPPPPMDPEMSAWSTDALMGMNSDSGMGSVFEEMQARHAARTHKAPIKKGPHQAAPQVVKETKEATPKPMVQAKPKAAPKTARQVKQNLVKKARAKAAQKKALARARKARRHAEAVARKADRSASQATMLTTHVFTETHHPVASSHPHMLTANVFGQHAAPKQRHTVVKKVVKKKAVRKVKKSHKPAVHHEEHVRVNLPHATRMHRRQQKGPTSPLDILNADPEQQHDASGASLTALASNMLTESDNVEKEKQAAAAKQLQAKAKLDMDKKQVKERLKKDGIRSGPTLNLDVDDTAEEELPDEKKLPPLDAFLPMGGDDDDGF